MKTFWGWRDKQLADGTLILTSPAGHTYVTTPGSALLFPSLCAATGAIPAPEADPAPDYCAERTAMMPRRIRTRAHNRATRIAGERKHNRDARLARRAPAATCSWPAVYGPDDDPPPF
ncbi:hypothetical protein MTIM_35770 [Mycobacterium timonense]|uniref:HNH endonuclease n=1 Tax=Mycobacterium timonense TaxID=701043 RepID=A0A7I9ZA06_9MYCO|nr:hypothetical protein MTIM_35770 [Mycobacterium timonense]